MKTGKDWQKTAKMKTRIKPVGRTLVDLMM